MSSCFLLFCLFLFPIYTFSLKLTPPLLTRSGPVQGYLSPVNSTFSLSIFRSIPFATPPVGPLRFRRSIPPTPWNSTLLSVFERHSCPQLGLTSFLYLGNEDCLTLNVYTPTNAIQNNKAALLPVLVFFYGGAYIFGSKNEFGFYDATRLVSTHNYVFVSVNYRLGALGFMSLPEFAQEDERNATGNWGLLDQQLALEWVRDNIEAFGGDSSRVTISGESAGAFSVCWHLSATASNQLFRSAILESGTCDSRFFYSTRQQSFDFGRLFAQSVGCKQELAECLRELPAGNLIQPLLGMNKFHHSNAESPEWFNWSVEELESLSLDDLNELNGLQGFDSQGNPSRPSLDSLLKQYFHTFKSNVDDNLASFTQRLKEFQFYSDSFHFSSSFVPALFPVFPWGPTIDGVECLDLPVNRFLAGQVNRWSNSSLTVLMGTNRNEGTIFVPILYFLQSLQWKLHIPLFTSDLTPIIQNFFPSGNLSQQILQYYELNTPRNNSLLGPTRIASHVIRDYMFFCSTRRAAIALNAISGVRTFVYQFDYVEDFLEYPFVGDNHMAELEFVFSNPFPPIFHIFSKNDWTMAGIMGQYWANLVWSGKSPNSESDHSLAYWPAFEPFNRTTMILQLQSSTANRLWFDTCQLWDSVFHAIEAQPHNH